MTLIIFPPCASPFEPFALTPLTLCGGFFLSDKPSDKPIYSNRYPHSSLRWARSEYTRYEIHFHPQQPSPRTAYGVGIHILIGTMGGVKGL